MLFFPIFFPTGNEDYSVRIMKKLKKINRVPPIDFDQF